MLKFLTPKFLKKIDERLLLNSPILWISKIHFVFYYTILLTLLSVIVALLVPVNLENLIQPEVFYTLLSIIAVILLCVWVYKNAIYNIESNYGNRKMIDEYKVFFTYFVSIFMLFSFPYTYSIVYNARIAATIPTEELISDINTLNVAQPFFVDNTYDYVSVQFSKYDSLHPKPDSTGDLYGDNYYTKFDVNTYVSWNKYTPYKLISDSTSWPEILTANDQEKQFNAIKRTDSRALQAIQDYIRVYAKYRPEAVKISPAEILKRYKQLCKDPIENLAQDDPLSININNYYYDSYQVQTIFGNVCNAKLNNVVVYSWEFNLFMFYLVFYLTLLLMLFKSVKWQQFLITIVSLIVIPIVLLIFSLLLDLSTGSIFKEVFTTSLLLVYIGALIFSVIFFFNSSKFSAFKNVCMQLVYISTPVLFLYFIFYLDENTNAFGKDSYFSYSYDYEQKQIDSIVVAMEAANQMAAPVDSSHINQTVSDSLAMVKQQRQQAIYDANYRYNRNLFASWIWGALIFGIVFHISFFMVFMKQQFLKMKSLPGNS